MGRAMLKLFPEHVFICVRLSYDIMFEYAAIKMVFAE